MGLPPGLLPRIRNCVVIRYDKGQFEPSQVRNSKLSTELRLRL